MTYTQRMYDALTRLGKQRKEEGKLPNQYDDLIGEINRLNNVLKDKWQPIETAPKDKYIIVFMANPYPTAEIFIARWSDIYKSFCVFGTYRERPDEYSEPNVMTLRNPTNWMPLPEPPKDK